MQRYYTRACNFYYGAQSKIFVKKKKSLPLNGNKEISFNQIEIITRQSKKIIFIDQINKLPKILKKKINSDLKKIISKKKSFCNLKFNVIPNLIGILNLTPDSFSDGGKFNKKDQAIQQAIKLFNSGAKLIDIGGESTRPGSKSINENLEWRRINKILKILTKKMPISLDTRKSNIMKKGIKTGVKLINDVSGLEYDPETANVLKQYNTPFVLQHSKGLPENMQNNPTYKNELLDIYDFFDNKLKFLRLIGINHNKIIIDPGIGFGKNLKHNMNLIKNISIFHSLGFPILVGNSRKRFIKDISKNNDSKLRTGGTLASSIFLMTQGIQILTCFLLEILILDQTKLFNTAIQAHREGNLNRARLIYRQLIELNPEHASGWMNIGLVYQSLDEPDEALAALKKAAGLAPDNAVIYYNLGNAFQLKNDLENAALSFQKALELKPDFSYAYYNLGLLYWENNQLEYAIKILQQANSISPKNPEILASLGAVFKSSGDLKEAENKTLEALKLKVDPKFKFNLATIFRDQGLLDDAKSMYEETILLEPNFVEAYNNIGEVLRDQGHSSLAKDFFNKALSKDNNFSMANYNLGILNQDAGDFDKAVDFFKKSKAFDWQQRICYCAYKNNHTILFEKIFNDLNNFKHDSPLIASIASHYSLNNKINDSYKFCPDPFSLIRKAPLETLSSKNSSLRIDLINDLKNTEIAERKQGKLINGIQSAGNILKRDEQSFRMLAGLIIVEIDNYLTEFKQLDCEFINSFPKKPEFQSSWYVKMQKSGHLTSHIHETGWLSGVLYIQLPNKTKTPEEGTIEFGFDGDNYPEGSTLPTERISLELGDLILFPSSLFHRTLPFYSDEERICIAFDISPPN